MPFKWGEKFTRDLPGAVAGDFSRLWRTIVEGIGPGPCQVVDTVTGPTVRVPKIVKIEYGPPMSFTVEMLPGQLVEDFTAVADRIAPHLGAVCVRVVPVGLTHVKLVLLASDPLAEVMPAVKPVESALDPIILGRDETGTPVTLELGAAAHLASQGATGSGKSVGTYSLLGQLRDAPDVRVTGVDPTGLLLGPWRGRWTDVPAPVCGTKNPDRYVITLDRVVQEMDRRIGAMPPGRDSVQLGSECPVLLVVLEEHPGALRVLDGADAKLGKSYRALVGRLLAEGRKAGIRVLLITQRADAAIVGAYERSQASHRISYRVDSADGLRMLHPDVSPDTAAEHASAPAGVALVTIPGQPLTRMRSPYVSYAEYCSGLGGPGSRAAA